MVLKALYDPDSFFSRYKNGWILPIAVVALTALEGCVLGYLKFEQLKAELIKSIPMSGNESFSLEFVKITLVSSTLLGTFIWWLLISGILYGLSALFSGEGSFERTMKNMSFVFLPSLILSPVSFVVSTGLKPSVPSLIIGIAVNIWQAFIAVFALKHARNLKLGNAVICVALVFAVLMALSVFGFYMGLKMRGVQP